MSASNNLIDKEIIRSKCWNKLEHSLLSLKLRDNKGLLKFRDIHRMLVRYLMIQIIERTPDDDPVFIIKPNDIAVKQLRDDFAYMKIIGTHEKFLDTLYHEFIKYKICLDNFHDKNPSIPTLDKTTRIIRYNDKHWKIPFTVDDDKLSYVVALLIRYDYLDINSYELCNDYTSTQLKPNDSVGEFFASPFNHYFDYYFSAFPDLEIPLGSNGSIWNLTKIPEHLSVCFINPPFDASIIRVLLNKINSWMSLASNNITIYLTIPYWSDMEEIANMSDNTYYKSERIIHKRETRFIDHKTKNVIQPCDILKVVFERTFTG